MKVTNLDNLGMVAEIIEEIGIEEEINTIIGKISIEKVSAGVIVKAMLLNGLGFVSAPICATPTNIAAAKCIRT